MFTSNTCEIRCEVNHSAQLHCKCRVGILTVVRGPRHKLEYSNILAEGCLNIFSLSFVHGLHDVVKIRPIRRKTLNNQSINQSSNHLYLVYSGVSRFCCIYQFYDWITLHFTNHLKCTLKC